MTELVAPKVGGVKLFDGKMIPAKQKIDGGPSVLYDAVALLISEAGADKLKKDAPTRDFIADAFAHLKFIGYTPAAMPLMEKAGIADSLDQGCVKLDGAGDAKNFVDLLPTLRVWDREMKVDVDA